MVLVSINYRLGAEGFLEIPGAPANRAVRDWVRALEWASGGAVGGRRDAEAVTTLLAGGIQLPWAPYADGEVVAEEPVPAVASAADSITASVAASARHREVSLLAGATAHEFNAAWMTADWITAAMVADGLAKAGVPASLAAAYLDRAGPPGSAVGQAVTDRVSGTRRVGRMSVNGCCPLSRRWHDGQP